MRFRLYPTSAQEAVMARHCADARYVWNLALEQANYWRRGRKPSPSRAEQSRQLTEAREGSWLGEGSAVIQQQALRDFDQAMRYFFAGTHHRPTWRKAGSHEGFRQVNVEPAHVVRLNRRWGKVLVPKCGWVRFRWTRVVPADVHSYRVTLDRTERWHIAFALVPPLVDGPGDGSVVGIDRGVVLSLACSDGTTYSAPKPTNTTRVKRRLSKAKRGSVHRQHAKHRVAKMAARDTDRRKDWAEKATTDLARRFDVVRIEDLRIKNMIRSAKGTVAKPGRNVRAKAGLNRSILNNGWGLVERRLKDKIGHRLEKVPAAFTSQRCSCCGQVDQDSRESQARFRCTSCGYSDNADVNAAKNIAAGLAVTARGGIRLSTEPVNREPQLVASG